MPCVSHHVLSVVALAAATLVAAGCASTSSAPGERAAAPTQSTVRVDGGGKSVYQTELTHNDRATETDLLATPDRAFALLPIVYEQLGLQINTAVSETRTIGATGVRTRRIGKDMISRFLSCGRDVTGGALADSYAVTLTVLSRVTPSGTTGSMLSTQVLGTAQPMSTSGSVVTCESTGVLEDRIAKTLTLRGAT